MSYEQNTEDKKDLIGVDPLAWLSDEEKQSLEQEKQVTIASEDQDQSEPTSDADNTHTFTFENALTIRDVDDLMEELKQIDESINEIIFDLGELERVDTAALQLLSVVSLSVSHSDKTISWKNPGESFCHSVRLLGLQDILPAVSDAA